MIRKTTTALIRHTFKPLYIFSRKTGLNPTFSLFCGVLPRFLLLHSISLFYGLILDWLIYSLITTIFITLVVRIQQSTRIEAKKLVFSTNCMIRNLNNSIHRLINKTELVQNQYIQAIKEFKRISQHEKNNTKLLNDQTETILKLRRKLTRLHALIDQGNTLLDEALKAQKALKKRYFK